VDFGGGPVEKTASAAADRGDGGVLASLGAERLYHAL